MISSPGNDRRADSSRRLLSRIRLPFQQLFHIFTNNIEFQIDSRSFAESREIGMLVCVRNDRYRKRAIAGVKTGKTYTVDRDGAFFHRDVSKAGVVGNIEEPASSCILNTRHNTRLVDMPLDDVTIKPAVIKHATLKVDLVAQGERSQR